MTQLWCLVVKEWRQMVRDPAGLLMLFVLPTAFIIGLSVALQGAFSSPDKKEQLVVCVAGGDQGFAKELATVIRDTKLFRVRDGFEQGSTGREAARSDVGAGQCAMSVLVPDDMTEAVRLEGVARVELVADPVLSVPVVVGVEGLIVKAASSGTIGYLLARTGQASEPAQVRKLIETKGPQVAKSYATRRNTDVRPNEVQQNVPGWTIFALFWLAQLLALTMLTEMTSGAHVRIVASPVSRTVYMLGKFLPFLLVNLLQAVTMFSVGVFVLPWFGCPRLALANIPALLLLTVAVSLVVVSFGLLMASVSRSHFTVGGLTATLLVLMAIGGGIMVPKYIMPQSMQTLSLLLPHGWALDGYQKVLVRGGGIGDVVPQVGALLGFAAAFFLAACSRLPWRPR